MRMPKESQTQLRRVLRIRWALWVILAAFFLYEGGVISGNFPHPSTSAKMILLFAVVCAIFLSGVGIYQERRLRKEAGRHI
jgi:hypothetical protein